MCLILQQDKSISYFEQIENSTNSDQAEIAAFKNQENFCVKFPLHLTCIPSRAPYNMPCKNMLCDSFYFSCYAICVTTEFIICNLYIQHHISVLTCIFNVFCGHKISLLSNLCKNASEAFLTLTIGVVRSAKMHLTT